MLPHLGPSHPARFYTAYRQGNPASAQMLSGTFLDSSHDLFHFTNAPDILVFGLGLGCLHFLQSVVDMPDLDQFCKLSFHLLVSFRCLCT